MTEPNELHELAVEKLATLRAYAREIVAERNEIARQGKIRAAKEYLRCTSDLVTDLNNVHNEGATMLRSAMECAAFLGETDDD